MANEKSKPVDDGLVEVTCATDVFRKGAMHRAGTVLRVSPEDAKADCFKTAAALQSEADYEAERAAATKAETNEFWGRVREAAAIRKQNELAQAAAAQKQLDTQAARAREALQHAKQVAAA